MRVHGKLTIRELQSDDDLLWDVALEIGKETEEVSRLLKKHVKSTFGDEDDAIEDVLIYVPEDLRERTVGDARGNVSLRQSLAKWTDESINEIDVELKSTNASKKLENAFKFNWPQTPRQSSTRKPRKKKTGSRSRKTGTRKMKSAPTTPMVQAVAFDYDVALSFAGEDRPQAEAIASLLIKRGVRVFYDKHEQADLWGKDLYTHLIEVYQKKARYCLMFLSEHYARKLWTNHERSAAQARAFAESKEYILPLKLDDAQIPGVLNTVGHVDLRSTPSSEVVDLLLKKLK